MMMEADERCSPVAHCHLPDVIYLIRAPLGADHVLLTCLDSPSRVRPALRASRKFWQGFHKMKGAAHGGG
jgi:hypothetical protein